MYTNNPNTAKVAPEEETEEIELRWMGRSNDEIKKFPRSVRYNLGGDLQRLQDGLKPLDGGSMPGIGPGVYEIRDEDLGSWYRVIYLKQQANGKIYILRCFEKQSNQTSQVDIKAARLRLAEAKKELAEEEWIAKREARNKR